MNKQKIAPPACVQAPHETAKKRVIITVWKTTPTLFLYAGSTDGSETDNRKHYIPTTVVPKISRKSLETDPKAHATMLSLSLPPLPYFFPSS